MLIEKSENLTVLTKAFCIRGKTYLAASIFGAFPFDRKQELLDESEVWEIAGACIPKPEVFDAFLPKACGEFLAAGKCFSPSGKPTPALQVRLAVGRLEKTLVVFGPRKRPARFFKNMKIEPFTEIDITYEKAFGGPGFSKNPRGTGYPAGHSETDKQESLLPNVEHPGRLITSPNDSPDPAGIGPLGMDWPQRARYLGSYDGKWLKSRWPWFPDDFDPKYFNAAQPDQQLPGGFFQGNEPVAIEHMHAHRPRIDSALPGLRARCFVVSENRNKGEEFLELQAKLDTVWLFPNVLKGVLIWRAVKEVADEGAPEICALVAGVERLSESPRPAEFYRKMLDREAAAAPEPRPLPAEEEAAPPPAPPVDEKRPADPRQEFYKELEKQVADGETAIADQLRKLGLDPDKLIADLAAAPALAKAPEAVALSLDEALADLAKSEKEINDTLAKLGLDMDELLKPPKVVPPQSPSLAEIAGQLRQSGMIDDEIAAAMVDSDNKVREALRDVEQLEAQGAAPAAEPGSEAEPEMEGPIPFTRERVLESLSTGVSLAGAELSGLDLSGLDLQGISLAGAVLEGTNLSHSVLTRANLAGALLAGADLYRARLDSAALAGANLSACKARETDFSGADLKGADLSRADLSRASFRGASLDNGIFEETVLQGAALEGVSARSSLFSSADLTDGRLIEADLGAADFSGTKLDNTDFSGSIMPSCSFMEASGRRPRFTGAKLPESRADKATAFQQADFQETDLSGANWEGASLDGARFGHALLWRADFSNCSLQAADFYRAEANQARFAGANLEKANLTSINLFHGDLSKARLVQTDLKGSNLFEAEFLNATVSKANFHKANLKRTKLAGWMPDDER